MNNVNLIGRLTKDNEVKMTNSGKSVVAFTLAVNRRVSKEAEQQADFINCVAWGKTAENMAIYTHKGSLVGVTGRISTRNYESNGKKVYVTEVMVDELQYLEKKNSNQSNEPDFSRFNTGEPLNIADDDLPF